MSSTLLRTVPALRGALRASGAPKAAGAMASTSFVRGKATLPDLAYDYGALEPHISGKIMELHHAKHHQTYVNGLNSALQTIGEAESKGDFTKAASVAPLLNFHGGGHINHSLFWENLAPASREGGGEPDGALKKAIDSDFGSFDTFRSQMNTALAGIQSLGGSSKVEDPIAEPETCKRDIEKFKDLGINTVRIYTVDNSANHDECMNALAEAGIYLALDVNTPKYSLNRNEPKASYNDVYLQNVFATIDAFANYDNTLLFFSGNEVINDDKTTGAAPYVKAVTRDMRQYIGSRGYRKIPVGYSAADVDSNRFEMAQYMNCGTDDERSDFFAFNDYSWCDPSSFTKSGWDQKVKKYSNYSIPLFLSEYGCNTNERKFEEVKSLYSDDMTAVYSGGLVYEYSEEGSNYGLVKISGNDVTEKSDYTALKSALKDTPAPSGDGGYKSDGSASECPSQSKSWDVTGDALPAIPEPAKKYMKSGAGEGKGLSGPGSQNAGTASTGTASAGSGTVTETASASGSSSSGSAGAAAGLKVPAFETAPLVAGLVVVASTFFGAALL